MDLTDVRCDRCKHWVRVASSRLGECLGCRVSGGIPVRQGMILGNDNLQTPPDFGCVRFEPVSMEHGQGEEVDK